ncbi:MAG: hypothetical protein JW863_19705 [Chitinispirillaceae bacterium]|nr:hypothetical protein [Chitinispirillaceae bacterium]
MRAWAENGTIKRNINVIIIDTTDTGAQWAVLFIKNLQRWPPFGTTQTDIDLFEMDKVIPDKFGRGTTAIYKLYNI